MSGNNVREEVLWLRHKGVGQDHAGRPEFSVAVGNMGRVSFRGMECISPAARVGNKSPSDVTRQN